MDRSDPPGSELPPLPASGWSGKERLLLVVLLVALAALMVFRAQTRRPDGSRMPARPDILVLHVGGLRGDAAPLPSLSANLGFRVDRLLVFDQAFAPSTDVRRSLLSLLSGDLVLDLDAPLGPGALAPALSAAGWQTLLIAEGELPAPASLGFDRVVAVNARSDAPKALEGLLDSAAEGEPVLALVHLGGSGALLHGDTTEALELRARYAALVVDLQATITRLTQASLGRSRPMLVVLVGASGMELGEHPQAPDLPWDKRLHVPFVVGLRGTTGMPLGQHPVPVQTTDLAPTLLGFLDVPPVGATADAIGFSLEPTAEGWTRPPVGRPLFFADRGFAAVRTHEWKLIAPIWEPWSPHADAALLFSLREDPQEHHDLAAGRELGPLGKELFADLTSRLRGVSGR